MHAHSPMSQFLLFDEADSQPPAQSDKAQQDHYQQHHQQQQRSGEVLPEPATPTSAASAAVAPVLRDMSLAARTSPPSQSTPPRPIDQLREDQKENMWTRWALHKLPTWTFVSRDDATIREPPSQQPPPAPPPRRSSSLGRTPLPAHVSERGHGCTDAAGSPSNINARRANRRVVPELPRPGTFHRQNSERRERLIPYEPPVEERRARSADKKSVKSLTGMRLEMSPPPMNIPSRSAPEIRSVDDLRSQIDPFVDEPVLPSGDVGTELWRQGVLDQPPSFQPDILPPLEAEPDDPPTDLDDDAVEAMEQRRLHEELEAKWILNLSMHFRDMSDREKFFVTYAEEPNKWRRVTVSCDYRHMEPDSLEADLKSLHYHRDKSAKIYESIRDSLLDIQFYDTVTNLKLQTEQGRLHVHVTEDVNEIIPYPSVNATSHLNPRLVRESEVHFDSHISGFVYRVNVHGKALIKKEIPGPDTVEEFLYEVNALCSLKMAQSVIKFEGLITDERGEVIKGLLISFAENGALVDLLFDLKGQPALAWARREKWAKQIVAGLAEVHEAGFVQGDFTLSNIVIDSTDNAKIIDINRRGCPVGWEPPELWNLIERGQRISIFIGVKSDLFQLGMVLWALAEQQDEPERQERPLEFTDASNDVPEYFKEIVRNCLSELPRNRLLAKELLLKFPEETGTDSFASTETALTALPPNEGSGYTSSSLSTVTRKPANKEYIDPDTAVNLSDIHEHNHHLHRLRRQKQKSGEHQHLSHSHKSSLSSATSTTSPYYYPVDSSGSYMFPATTTTTSGAPSISQMSSVDDIAVRSRNSRLHRNSRSAPASPPIHRKFDVTEPSHRSSRGRVDAYDAGDADEEADTEEGELIDIPKDPAERETNASIDRAANAATSDRWEHVYVDGNRVIEKPIEHHAKHASLPSPNKDSPAVDEVARILLPSPIPITPDEPASPRRSHHHHRHTHHSHAHHNPTSSADKQSKSPLDTKFATRTPAADFAPAILPAFANEHDLDMGTDTDLDEDIYSPYRRRRRHSHTHSHNHNHQNHTHKHHRRTSSYERIPTTTTTNHHVPAFLTDFPPYDNVHDNHAMASPTTTTMSPSKATFHDRVALQSSALLSALEKEVLTPDREKDRYEAEAEDERKDEYRGKSEGIKQTRRGGYEERDREELLRGVGGVGGSGGSVVAAEVAVGDGSEGDETRVGRVVRGEQLPV